MGTSQQTPARYAVGYVRASGLEARWGRTRQGAPIILVRDPQARHRHQREQWWFLDRGMWADAHKLEAGQPVGLREAFDRHTLVADFFSF